MVESVSGKKKREKRKRPVSDSPPLARDQLPGDRGLAGWTTWCESELMKNQTAVDKLKKRYDKFVSKGENKDELIQELLNKLADGSDEIAKKALVKMFETGKSKEFMSMLEMEEQDDK